MSVLVEHREAPSHVVRGLGGIQEYDRKTIRGVLIMRRRETTQRVIDAQMSVVKIHGKRTKKDPVFMCGELIDD